MTLFSSIAFTDSSYACTSVHTAASFYRVQVLCSYFSIRTGKKETVPANHKTCTDTFKGGLNNVFF
jgi:hypothetical protein